MGLGVDDPFPGEAGTVADVLLRVHRSYLAVLRPLLGRVHAMAHITGGGLPGNVNRALPDTLDAEIDAGSWEVPNLFRQLERAGQVDRAEMYRTFNMGVGMVVITDEAGAKAVQASAESAHIGNWRLGRIVRGAGQVRIT
jgi:phosphoribosylformylglycinamidine cyclo-ligase